MIFAAVNESFSVPLIILSVIPPSLGLPLILMILTGSSVNSAVCCSLIAVSGIAVNAAVIITGELNQFFKGKIELTVFIIHKYARRCIPCLFAISGTTIAGTLPFLFIRSGSNSLITTLSAVIATGVTVSFVTSFTLIPSIMVLINSYKGVKYE